jgi:hypothetical protein
MKYVICIILIIIIHVYIQLGDRQNLGVPSFRKNINGLFSHKQLPRGNSDAYLLLNTTKLMYQRF